MSLDKFLEDFEVSWGLSSSIYSPYEIIMRRSDAHPRVSRGSCESRRTLGPWSRGPESRALAECSHWPPSLWTCPAPWIRWCYFETKRTPISGLATWRWNKHLVLLRNLDQTPGKILGFFLVRLDDKPESKFHVPIQTRILNSLRVWVSFKWLRSKPQAPRHLHLSVKEGPNDVLIPDWDPFYEHELIPSTYLLNSNACPYRL